MLDNITFIDLISLIKITPDATVEKFGGLINSSFFDASNILGTLKQKGLVEFVTAFPSQSALSVTEQGKQLIAEVEAKAATAFDTLDMTMLTQLSSGKKNLPDLTAVMNITSKDLAFHLYKLSVQKYISYELRNGNMTMLLTEKGFLCVKEGMPRDESQKQAAQMAGPQPVTPTVLATSATPIQQAPEIKSEAELKEMDSNISAKIRMKSIITIILVIVFVAAIAYLYFFTHLIK
ncbi:MAG: hypothetical protein ACHQX1_01465 [Candidatus Micrarchaeales archaeon]